MSPQSLRQAILPDAGGIEEKLRTQFVSGNTFGVLGVCSQGERALFESRQPRLPLIELAIHAARYASCANSDAESFAGSVEAAVHACLREASSSATISVVVRRDAGPLEFLIDGRTVAVEP